MGGKVTQGHAGSWTSTAFPDEAYRKGGLDILTTQEVAKEQDIRSMPTFRVFKDGQKIDETVGAVPAKLTVSLSWS